MAPVAPVAAVADTADFRRRGKAEMQGPAAQQRMSRQLGPCGNVMGHTMIQNDNV